MQEKKKKKNAMFYGRVQRTAVEYSTVLPFNNVQYVSVVHNVEVFLSAVVRSSVTSNVSNWRSVECSSVQ